MGSLDDQQIPYQYGPELNLPFQTLTLRKDSNIRYAVDIHVLDEERKEVLKPEPLLETRFLKTVADQENFRTWLIAQNQRLHHQNETLKNQLDEVEWYETKKALEVLLFYNKYLSNWVPNGVMPFFSSYLPIAVGTAIVAKILRWQKFTLPGRFSFVVGPLIPFIATAYTYSYRSRKDVFYQPDPLSLFSNAGFAAGAMASVHYIFNLSPAFRFLPVIYCGGLGLAFDHLEPLTMRKKLENTNKEYLDKSEQFDEKFFWEPKTYPMDKRVTDYIREPIQNWVREHPPAAMLSLYAVRFYRWIASGPSEKDDESETESQFKVPPYDFEKQIDYVEIEEDN